MIDVLTFTNNLRGIKETLNNLESDGWDIINATPESPNQVQIPYVAQTWVVIVKKKELSDEK